MGAARACSGKSQASVDASDDDLSGNPFASPMPPASPESHASLPRAPSGHFEQSYLPQPAAGLGSASRLASVTSPTTFRMPGSRRPSISSGSASRVLDFESSAAAEIQLMANADASEYSRIISSLIEEKQRASREQQQLRLMLLNTQELNDLLKTDFNRLMIEHNEALERKGEMFALARNLKRQLDDQATAQQESAQQHEMLREQLDEARVRIRALDAELEEMTASHARVLEDNLRHCEEMDLQRQLLEKHLNNSASASKRAVEVEREIAMLRSENDRLQAEKATQAREQAALQEKLDIARSGKFGALDARITELEVENARLKDDMRAAEIARDEKEIFAGEMLEANEFMRAKYESAKMEVDFFKEQFKVVLREVSELQALLDDTTTEMSPDIVIGHLADGKHWYLRTLRSMQTKKRALELAVERCNPDVTLVVVLYCRETLHDQLFYGLLAQLPFAQRAYIRFLQTLGRTTELREMYSALGLVHDMGMSLLREIFALEQPEQSRMLRTHMAWFQSHAEFTEIATTFLEKMLQSPSGLLAPALTSSASTSSLSASLTTAAPTPVRAPPAARASSPMPLPPSASAAASVATSASSLPRAGAASPALPASPVVASAAPQQPRGQAGASVMRAASPSRPMSVPQSLPAGASQAETTGRSMSKRRSARGRSSREPSPTPPPTANGYQHHHAVTDDELPPVNTIFELE